MSSGKILIVEDEALVAEDIRQHLVEAGYDVVATANRGEAALDILSRQSVDLVMLDIMLAGEWDGIETAEQIRRHYQTPVVFLTAYSDQAKLDRARVTEPYGYLIKPFDERELKSTLAMAMYKSESDRQGREARRWTQTVLGTLDWGVVTVDSLGKIEYLNRYAEKYFSAALADVSGRDIDTLFMLSQSKDYVSVSEMIKPLLDMADEQTLTDELPVHVDNQDRVLHLTCAQLRVQNHHVDGIVMTFSDITHLKGIEAELRHLNTELSDLMSTRTKILSRLNRDLELEKEAAETASAIKGDYLKYVHHNLMTVCQSVIRMTEAMTQSGSLSLEQRRQLKDIASSVQDHMRDVAQIDDIAEIENIRG